MELKAKRWLVGVGMTLLLVEFVTVAWGQQALQERKDAYQRKQDDLFRARIKQQFMQANRAKNEIVNSNSLFNPTEELSFYQGKLQEARQQEDRTGELSALNSIGQVYEKMGDYTQAMSFYTQVLQLAEKQQNKVWVGHALNNISGIHSRLGNYSEALEIGQNALQQARERHDRDQEASVLANLSAYYAKSENYPKALEYTQQALQLAPKSSDSKKVWEGNLGAIYLALGRRKEAFEIFKRQGDSLRLGRYYLLNGEYQQARDEFEKAITIAKSVRERSVWFLGINMTMPYGYQRDAEDALVLRIGLGHALEGLKNYDDARFQYQQAVDLIEQQRNSLSDEQRQYFFAAKIFGFSRLDPYEGLVRVSIYLKDTAKGFFWAENTRARLLLEAVARRTPENRLGLPADFDRREFALISRATSMIREDVARQLEVTQQEKTTRHREMTRSQAVLLSGEGDSSVLNAQMMDEIKRDRDVLLTRIRKQYPAYAAIQYPQPVQVTDLTLSPEEVLIEYEVTELATFAWLIKGQQILKVVIIPVTRAKLTEKVLQYLQYFKDIRNYAQLSQFDPRLGKYFYDLLFKDVATHLKEEDRLIIVPDEVLGMLPFEALVMELPGTVTYGSGVYGTYPKDIKYLGDQYDIRYSQSASALVQARSLHQAKPNKPERVLVVADPVFNVADARLQGKTYLLANQEKESQPKLMRAIEEDQPGVSNETPLFTELSKIRQLTGQLQHLYGNEMEVLSGLTASEATLRKQPLAEYQEVIFATHGVLAKEVATVREPALVLNQVEVNRQNPEQDGFLTLSEVMGLSLNAEVVALLACNTGVGKTQTGEGVMGMGRAFQYAGAKSVLMTLWSVNEESTSRFAEQFFSQLKAGKDRLSALRFARTEVRKAGYEHPFFWAPFILVGDR